MDMLEEDFIVLDEQKEKFAVNGIEQPSAKPAVDDKGLNVGIE